MRYTKYKKYYKISCFGNNDVWANRADSQYRTSGISFTNGKTCRFNFNGAFNDVILSKNAHNFRVCFFFDCYKYCKLCKYKNCNKYRR